MKTITRVLAALIFAGWAGSVSAVPITGANIVTVDGKDWAQVNLFTGLSWAEMDAVCPAGICVDTGMLNGYDMLGWSWVSADGVNDLFNTYIGSAQLGPGPDNYLDVPGDFAAAFFNDGWEATQHAFPSPDLPLQNSSETVGLMSDNGTLVGVIGYLDSPSIGIANTNTDISDPANISIGGWFSRPAANAPTPATLGLFSLSLVGLGWVRRMKA
jgi:hypothetical protein